MPQHTGGGHRTAFRVWFFASTLWVPSFKLGSSLGIQCLKAEHLTDFVLRAIVRHSVQWLKLWILSKDTNDSGPKNTGLFSKQRQRPYMLRFVLVFRWAYCRSINNFIPFRLTTALPAWRRTTKQSTKVNTQKKPKWCIFEKSIPIVPGLPKRYL